MQTEPRVGCGAAIVVAGRLLLIERLTPPEAGCWGLPGGKIDLFEDARTATAREIHEELGIVIDPVDLLCVVDLIDRERGTHWLSPVYLVDRFTGTPVNREPGKHRGPEWYPLDALPDRLTTPTIIAVDAYRARQAAVPSDPR